ncbi:MAG: M20/M25/M40 family metallo-hydrolase [Thermoplasmata archaeon]
MTLPEYVRKTLTEFVRISSTPDTDMSEILAAATKAVEALGLRAEVHADVKAVLASSGKGGAMFNGHLDTVPMASGWTREQGSWDGDFLYGRGTADMKAGCVAGLAAAMQLLAKKVPFSLLFTTDEETTMHGSIKLASSEAVRDAAAVVVAEPTALKVIASEKGVLWYRATTRGRSAHGSMPHLGDNAIYRMARVLPHLERLGKSTDMLKEITVNLGAIRGGSAPNIVADTCTVDLDCRNPPSMSKDDVEALLRNAFSASGQTVELELFHEVPAAAVPKDAPHVRLLRDLAGTSVVGVTYGTEMAYYAKHNPRCLVFGPGETERIHVPDERVSLSEVVRAAEILEEYATRLAPASRARGRS